MQTTVRRLVPSAAAAIVTSAIVAAIAVAGQSGQQAAQAGPPQPTSQAAGQLSIEGGALIPVLSYSLGASASPSDDSGGGGGAGKVVFTDLTVVKSVDKGTPSLFVTVASGRHLQNVAFTAQWGVGSAAATMAYQFEDVLVTEVSNSGAGGAPRELLSFDFGKVTWTYTDASGTSTGCWDVTANSSC